MGDIRTAERVYRRAAWGIGALIYGAMAVQEAVLLASGLLSWQTGLPLHLCSMMGLLTLPALLTRRAMLLNTAFFAGMPGAALALLFPAVLNTPWPRLTALAFHALHAGLLCTPLLPLARGWRPRSQGAAQAWLALLLAAGAAMLVNALTGGNYLFLAAPVPGTPLAWLAQWGILRYRLLLALLASTMLTAEAALLFWIRRGFFAENRQGRCTKTQNVAGEFLLLHPTFLHQLYKTVYNKEGGERYEALEGQNQHND